LVKNTALILIAGDLLRLIREKGDVTPHLVRLKSISLSDLKREIPDDHSKLVFWINMYNAVYLLNSSNPKQIFTRNALFFKDFSLSLDDIEHGILRRAKWKYSLGFFPDLMVSSVVRQLMVKKLDERIHFALNCGAVSCPPIRFYTIENLEEQFKIAEESFMQSETNWDLGKRKVYVSKIFLWYWGDFGGRTGVLRRLQQHFHIDFSGFKIRFNPYNWDSSI
jgi:hypothetical protein